MRLLLVYTCLLISVSCLSQNKRDTIYKDHGSYEIKASYRGGEKALERHFRKNLRYPPAAKRDKLEDSVVVQFVVDKLGNITDAFVLNNVRSDLKQEALRLVYAQKQWIPYEMNGRNYKSYKKRTIYFRLNRP